MSKDAKQTGSAMLNTASKQPPRVIRPTRNEPYWDTVDPETWLSGDHMARAVWAFVEGAELTPLYDRIKARGSEPGRPAADPAVLFALWLLAAVDGVGAARELERCTRERIPYMWLSHGVPINYHGLADFRIAHAELLDDLLTKHLASLMAAHVVNVEDIIVDGTKVAASAGKSSYRRAPSLAKLETAAKERIAALKAEVEADTTAHSRREAAAKARAARETQKRVEEARRKLAEIEKERKQRAKTSPKEVADMKEARASTSDPEARKMRCADGAVRPAYNVQMAVTVEHGLITGIKATDRRQDSGLAGPMIAETERRTGSRVKRLLADMGYACEDDIVTLATRADTPVTCYVPLPQEQDDVKPETRKRRERKRAREPAPVKQWRERMTTAEAEAMMRKRGGIERVNGALKHRGLTRVAVRGLKKVQALALWQALAHNFTTGLRLAAEAAARTAATATVAAAAAA